MGMMHDTFADDADAICDLDGFGEAMTYYPQAGAAIPFVGLVRREAPRELPGGGIRGRRTVVYVPQKFVPSINPGGLEKIAVTERYGADASTAVKRAVVEILGEAGGMWKVRLG